MKQQLHQQQHQQSLFLQIKLNVKKILSTSTTIRSMMLDQRWRKKIFPLHLVKQRKVNNNNNNRSLIYSSSKKSYSHQLLTAFSNKSLATQWSLVDSLVDKKIMQTKVCFLKSANCHRQWTSPTKSLGQCWCSQRGEKCAHWSKWQQMLPFICMCRGQLNKSKKNVL